MSKKSRQKNLVKKTRQKNLAKKKPRQKICQKTHQKTQNNIKEPQGTSRNQKPPEKSELPQKRSGQSRFLEAPLVRQAVCELRNMANFSGSLKYHAKHWAVVLNRCNLI